MGSLGWWVISGNQTEFKSMRVLIVSSKTHVVGVLRNAFSINDVRQLTVAVSARAALETLKAHRFSAVFCADDCGDIDGVSFAVVMRRAPDVLFPMTALFLVCGSPRRRDVERARDSGYTDVVCRPLSAGTVARKLRQAAEFPRPFIAAADFFGPDRRVVREKTFQGQDRRKRNARKVKIAASEKYLDV